MTGTKALSVFGLAHTIMRDATKERIVKSFGKQSHDRQPHDYHHENLDLKAFMDQLLIDSVDCGPFENELTKHGSVAASIDRDGFEMCVQEVNTDEAQAREGITGDCVE